jgi:hypothetical protein
VELHEDPMESGPVRNAALGLVGDMVQILKVMILLFVSYLLQHKVVDKVARLEVKQLIYSASIDFNFKTRDMAFYAKKV